MVPLAHLIVVRHRLNMTAVMAHAASIGAGSINDLSLAQLCLPLDAPVHDVRVVEQNKGGFTVASDHHSIDFLQARSTSDAAIGLPGRGHVAQTLALQAGFPGNVLNVIRFGDRFFLNNGYHRAYALWKRGVTHVPAVIQVCRHWDDVALLGNLELYENTAVYVERERPPLIRDFADRLFCMSFAVPHARKYVRVRYTVETGYLR
jgi:hypothetical protein